MPSILPEYEYDIFISYRQKDNKYDGWVTEFVNNLQNELDSTFKEEVSIYFDENPHDGLLETHNVDKSLEGKLKCLVLIPIISRTYCDPKSFAWQNEFLAFLEEVTKDNHGKSVQLADGNIADRVLPVQIHDIDKEDQVLFEEAAGSVLRPVPFIYKLPGVNRQLRAIDDDQIKSPDQILYRDQVNKVAQAIKEIIGGMSQEPKGETKPIVEKKEELVAQPEPVEKPKTQKTTNLSKKSIKIALIILPLLVVGIFGFKYLSKWMMVQQARTEMLPRIEKLADENFRAPTEALDLALDAEKYIPNDSALLKLWPRISRSVSITTEPAGAEVYWKDYNTPEAEWRFAGITPLKEERFPQGYLRMEIKKDGFQTIEYAALGRQLQPQLDSIKLDPLGQLPENMVRIPKTKTNMLIVGLEHQGPRDVSEFLIDKLEVTNAAFKKFMDNGGYANKDYWQHPVVTEDEEISWDSALKIFVDKTGRQGPSTWEAGTYPDGKGNAPVTGVSWYEAAAYATYAKKQLPTVFHWASVAATGRTEFIVPLSNFNKKGTVAVGSQSGFSTFGIYDLAGNAREWCFNEGVEGQRFILGGGWNDPEYAFNDAYMQSPLNRGPSNGFRCIKELPGDSLIQGLYENVEMLFRDYSKEKPVDDQTFEMISRQFAYDNNSLESKIEQTYENEYWTAEKITFNAGYNDDRIEAYLYLPKNMPGPFQPVLYFPGSNAIFSRKYDPYRIGSIDFILKSGRALIRPIYKGTDERFDELSSDLPNESVFYKDHVIMWRKDIGRTLDYLETREDILSEKLGYLGWSWGGYMGGIMPAVEPRIKAIVLNVGGMVMNPSLPEVDQLNFLPRVKQPVLMLNGKHDMFFPMETSQKPMFNFFGTPQKHKKMIVYEAGHLVPKMDFVKESLAWYDTYLGPTK